MANKSAIQKRTDPEMEALKDAYNSGQQAKQAEVDALKARLDVAPWLYEMAGKIKTLSFNESQARFFKLVVLKQVKDGKEYREKFGMTWEQFCEELGFNRRTLDDQLIDLKPFKAEFLANFCQFSGFDFNKIKYLGSEKVAEHCQFTDNAIVFDGETIPVTPEHVEEIRDVIEKLQEDLKAEKDDKKASLSAKDKVLKAKEDLLNKQERQIQKFDKEAKAKGLTADEDAFLQKMEHMKTHFDGFYMLNVDPERIDIDADSSKRIRAAYISTLQYMKMQINAAFDTACDQYADVTMLPEEGWQPGKKA